MLVLSVLSALPPTDLLFGVTRDINVFLLPWVNKGIEHFQDKLDWLVNPCTVMHLAICLCFVWAVWGMTEGCFINAQLKSPVHNAHSVTVTNSSRHTIVCHRK